MELTEAHLRVLQALVAAGFEPASFPLFPAHVGVKKYGFAVLLKPLADGRLSPEVKPSYLVEGNLSVLVERGGEQWFVWKSHEVRATAALLAGLRRFEEELKRLLESPPTV